MSDIQPSVFSQCEVICLGEALVDRLGPLGGDPAIDRPVLDCLGGAPANVACALARLRTQTAFVGRLGNDSIGERFRSLMMLRGIHLAGLQRDDVFPSRIVLVRRTLNGERIFQGFLMEQSVAFADQLLDINKLSKAWHLFAEKARWLLVGTIPLATPSSAEALLWAVNHSLQQGLKIALDVNWRPTFWNPSLPPDQGPNLTARETIAPILESASLIKLAKEEALWFFNCCDPRQIASSLPNKPDVVVTNGSKPVTWFIAGCSGEMSIIPPSKVVDTTGAGDAFTAGLIHKLLLMDPSYGEAQQVLEIVRFAAACGALVCAGAGAIDPQPSQEEVLRFLDSSRGAIN